MSDPVIAPATPADMPAILAIYNEVIRTSTAVYEDDPVPLSEREAWFAGREAGGWPVLVSRDAAGAVTGFASYGPFRPKPGYRRTVEHTVHVRADCRGQGVGAALLTALIDHAEHSERGLRVMVGGVDGENAASIRFHARFGFKETARMPDVGEKFDRPLTLVLLQRALVPRPG